MPGGWPLRQFDANPQAIGAVSGTSNGVVVTSGGANTYGSWTQIVASTPADMADMLLQVTTIEVASAFQCVVDIAAAAAGSESSGTIISALMLGEPNLLQTSLRLPVGPIKAGTRLAARTADTTGGNNFNVIITGLDGDYISGDMPGVYDTYGGWSGSGKVTGTNMDPGATANTKGAWTQLASSLTHDIKGFHLGFDCQSFTGGSSSVPAPQLMDIAIGASGSEVVILPNLLVSKAPSNYTASVMPSITDLIRIPIKAGTRVAARTQSSNVTAFDRQFGLSFYGLRA